MLSLFQLNFRVHFVSSFYFIVFGNKRGIRESDEKIARCGIFIKKGAEMWILLRRENFCLQEKFCFLSEIYDSLQKLFEVTETLFLTLFKLSPAL